MEIVNATCYFTEDLSALLDKTLATLRSSALREALTKSRYGYFNEPTGIERIEMLRVGYYSPSEDPHEPGYSFTSLRSQRSVSPRVGIVKKGQLVQSPLHALATAGAEERLLPKEVVRDLTRTFSRICGSWTQSMEYRAGSSHDPDGEVSACWEWIDTFKVRYRDRAKRGSRKEIKRATEVAAFRKREATLDEVERELRYLQRQAELKARERRLLFAEIVAERKRLGLEG